MKISFRFKTLLLVLTLIGAIYGGGRLYYSLTGGFTLSNISSSLSYDERWKTHVLTPQEKAQIDQALDQEFTYLGKGCQAYVFQSRDGKYVLKFFKYQRFRPQEWVEVFAFIPAVKDYQAKKAVQKKAKLDNVFRSWKIAFEDLKNETGIVYVHLNKTDELKKNLTIRDKIGQQHTLDLDQMEFLLQRKANMLCPTIDVLVKTEGQESAKKLLDRLMAMLLSEYARGLADNDHALMQNTGVLEGFPIHIDVGQFIRNDVVKDSAVYKRELYDKTYKFHLWLKERHPDLALYLQGKLVDIIGDDYFHMGPYVHKGDVAKIPHREQTSSQFHNG